MTTMHEIRRVVGKVYKVPVRSMLDYNRKAQVHEARAVAMYLSRELLEHSYPRIAMGFRRLDHNSPMTAHKRIQARIGTDWDLRRRVVRCVARLNKPLKATYRDEGEAMRAVWS